MPVSEIRILQRRPPRQIVLRRDRCIHGVQRRPSQNHRRGVDDDVVEGDREQVPALCELDNYGSDERRAL